MMRGQAPKYFFLEPPLSIKQTWMTVVYWKSWLLFADLSTISRRVELVLSYKCSKCPLLAEVYSHWLTHNAFSSTATWRLLWCISLSPSCEQISSSTRSFNVRSHAEGFWPTTASLAFDGSAADPVGSTRRQIFCTVLNFHSLCEYVRIIPLSAIPANAASAFEFCPYATPFPLWLR